jgi:uncharacterized protein (DUF1697 family)
VPARVVLLRGINLGSRNRIAMPALRQALSEAGFKNVSTYVASGNVVLSSRLGSERLAKQITELVATEFDLEIPVVVRTAQELAEVVKRNPLGEVAAVEPKRYQVCFLDRELAPEMREKLDSLRAGKEQVTVLGREIYAWHPDGVGRSKLATKLAGTGLGVTGTARNWTTVTTLRQMAEEIA